MDRKQLTVYGIILIAIQIILGLKIFVTYPEMEAYAASTKEMDTIQKQLIRIEGKIDKLILGY